MVTLRTPFSRVYDYVEREVTIGGQKYQAIFPKEHSQIKGLVYHWKDIWADDPWANRSKYQLTIFIQNNNSESWKKPDDITWITTGMGYYQVLFGLEDKPTQELYRAQARKEELEVMIESGRKELESLDDKIKQLER